MKARYPRCMPWHYKVGQWLERQLSRLPFVKRKMIDGLNDKTCAFLTMYGGYEEE